MFNLDDTLYLYDLTSTYFEGEAPNNPQAKRGYSRDKRGDAKQVLVGLVLDRGGFSQSARDLRGQPPGPDHGGGDAGQLGETRGPRSPGSTVVVDRGMAYEEDLEQIRAHGYHYLVAGRQPERNAWLDEFEADDDWEEMVRTPSPRNPHQEKSRVWIKRRAEGERSLHSLPE